MLAQVSLETDSGEMLGLFTIAHVEMCTGSGRGSTKKRAHPDKEECGTNQYTVYIQQQGYESVQQTMLSHPSRELQ